ncbi:unnamed protein product [Anisakis simplex]|uniref:Tyrosine-protein kinase n=1 Tax=Anisakis simplex TaxID=6269 RepID=A0A0M3J0J9_ANISI|nr:unnamed protein product [Anisakis simplex]
MTSEYSLDYFHGALLDEDADKLLEKDGDFLIQARSDPNRTHTRLILAVRKGGKARRFDIQRLENGFRIVVRCRVIHETHTSHSLEMFNPLSMIKFSDRKWIVKWIDPMVHRIVNFQGRSFGDVKSLVEYYQARTIDCGKGETIHLKHAVPKGKYQMNHKDVKIQRKIGSGAYGTVYKAKLARDGQTVAVKRLDSDDKNEQGLIDMMKEARVMQLYDHPNVVRFFGFIVDRPPYLLVMEYCKDGSVEDKLRECGAIVSIATRVDMACQTARGIEYLHEKKCIHRDLATRNCLLSGQVLKLADFGMCRATLVYKIDLSKPQNVRWLAPEVWRTGETRFCTDIYAFGITLWEFFEIPYNPPYFGCSNSSCLKVMKGYRMPSPDDMPEAVITLMCKCWDHDPKRRPTAAEVRHELEEINKVRQFYLD